MWRLEEIFSRPQIDLSCKPSIIVSGCYPFSPTPPSHFVTHVISCPSSSTCPYLLHLHICILSCDVADARFYLLLIPLILQVYTHVNLSPNISFKLPLPLHLYNPTLYCARLPIILFSRAALISISPAIVVAHIISVNFMTFSFSPFSSCFSSSHRTANPHSSQLPSFQYPHTLLPHSLLYSRSSFLSISRFLYSTTYSPSTPHSRQHAINLVFQILDLCNQHPSPSSISHNMYCTILLLFTILHFLNHLLYVNQKWALKLDKFSVPAKGNKNVGKCGNPRIPGFNFNFCGVPCQLRKYFRSWPSATQSELGLCCARLSQNLKLCHLPPSS